MSLSQANKEKDTRGLSELVRTVQEKCVWVFFRIAGEEFMKGDCRSID